ncbi:MAG TPA: hypothetical protein VGX49_09955 [Jatrophihabitans sp.]|nr:hypothetical protein [Jatrophihabitans sp.]
MIVLAVSVSLLIVLANLAAVTIFVLRRTGVAARLRPPTATTGAKPGNPPNRARMR